MSTKPPPATGRPTRVHAGGQRARPLPAARYHAKRPLAFAARRAGAALLGAIVWTGCASPGVEVEADALLCFSGGLPEGAQEVGTLQIGEAGDEFDPLETDQVLSLVEGPTAEAYFELQLRFEDLEPGELGVHDAPNNPRTLISVWSEEGERLAGGSCGTKRAYAEDGQGVYRTESGRDLAVMLAREARERDGDRVRIEAEILDVQGRYAKTEAWVVARYEEF